MQSEKTKHVTNKQGTQFAALARKFGVSREDFAGFIKDEKKVKTLFESMNTETDAWFESLQAAATKIGARLHLITNLVVDYSKSHNDAAMAGGPQTESSYNVLKVSDKYQPSENKLTNETIVLLNYPKGGGNYGKTVQWGLENGLRKTTPHASFAVGEHKTKLNYELGPNPMYVVETTGCTFGGGTDACYVWWDDARRKSNLDWQDNFGNGRDWFAFRK
ncbi:MAG: hypothetical protein ABIO57_01230 [Candidatus Paceibacterota bacterium]